MFYYDCHSNNPNNVWWSKHVFSPTHSSGARIENNKDMRYCSNVSHTSIYGAVFFEYQNKRIACKCRTNMSHKHFINMKSSIFIERLSSYSHILSTVTHFHYKYIYRIYLLTRFFSFHYLFRQLNFNRLKSENFRFCFVRCHMQVVLLLASEFRMFNFI